MQTIAGLVKQGFPHPDIYWNTPVAKPKHINEVHSNIFNGHFSILERFQNVIMRQDKTKTTPLHLMVMEDDVLILDPNICSKMLSTVEYLDQYRPNWSILFLGCMCIGPALPIGNGLVHPCSPYSVHCYILNGRKVQSIVNMGRSICRRPIFPEGCEVFPFQDRFAFFAPLMGQTRPPKEFFLKNIPFVRDHFSFDMCMQAYMWCSVLIPILMLIVSLGLIISIRKRLQPSLK